MRFPPGVVAYSEPRHVFALHTAGRDGEALAQSAGDGLARSTPAALNFTDIDGVAGAGVVVKTFCKDTPENKGILRAPPDLSSQYRK